MTIPPDIRLNMDEYFRDPIAFPDEFKAWLIKYIEAFPPTLPITQIIVGGGNVAAPTGAIYQFAGSTAPSGFLLCDGSAVSRTDYPALFAVTSTTYGVGDGSTTFNLPDLQGRVPVGLSSGGATLVDTLGKNDGRAANVRSPSHWHRIGDPANTWVGGGGSGGATPGSPYSGYTTGDSNNLDSPAYLVINYIIKT